MAVFWNIVKRKDYSLRTCQLKLVAFIFCFFLFITTTSAQGDLLIFPKRIVFDGGKRVKQLILSNIGKDTAVYNVSFLQYRMDVNGGFKAIKTPDIGQYFATPYLRVFPRKVTLAPNESQIVKVQLTKSTKLKEGEYRSHLYFRAKKNNNPLGQKEKVVDSTSISVKLEAVFGISIATIIKKGKPNTVTTISDLFYEKDKELNHFINFNLNRTGNMSTYGDIHINYVSLKNTIVEVAKVKGVAVYTPGEVRKVKIQLKTPKGITFTGGKFKVVYTANESKKKLADAELDF
tara:strand:+ start:906 stop:1775 length:870 start_codon:yes stop_codon:yes gene_type:complete